MALQGTLDVMSVADVLGLLAATAKTGPLRLEDEAARGVVWVREGRVAAVTDAEPPIDGPVAEFLFWFAVRGGGWFTFEVDDDVPDGGQPAEVEAVVAELAALNREWGELHPVVPSVGHRVGLVARLPGPDVTIDATVWPAVLAAASEPTVGDLGAQFGLGDLDALRAVRDLVMTGIVEVHPPTGRETGPVPGAAGRAGRGSSPGVPVAPVGARRSAS